MFDAPSGPVHLPFSDKYDHEHSRAYLEKHRDGIARRLSHWRDEQLARNALALAGEPTLVLDLPCGAGRFWPLLAERPSRVIVGADNSSAMLEVAKTAHPPRLLDRVRTMQTSAFAIDLPDRSVDCVFSMRLAHHIGDAAHRLAMLREFHRVTRDTVILSLWVRGNYKAWKRMRLERERARDGHSGPQNRFLLPARAVEHEFRSAGFAIVGRRDFLPLYSMWRIYVLRRGGA